MYAVVFDAGGAGFQKAWATSFKAADKLNREIFPVTAAMSIAQLIGQFKAAAQKAHGGGEVVFAVGHGGLATGGSTVDFVDLAPSKKMRIVDGGGADAFVDPWYDWVKPNPGLVAQSDKTFDEKEAKAGNGKSPKLQRWDQYKAIGQAMRSGDVKRVWFLTCRIGQSPNFIKKIANDWGVDVRAYTRFVWFNKESPTRGRAWLDGDADGQGTNVPEAAERLPQVSFVTVGPPR
jgi:hypothetical protein